MDPLSHLEKYTREALALEIELEELRTLVEKSRRERAADRWLQNALEDLLAKHDSPWQREVLYDDFADGDFNRNPTWQVMRGQFQVTEIPLICSVT